MLIAALRQESDKAFADLLTPADLKALSGTTSKGELHNLPSNKRYLILTHMDEFERVHYPLPLACQVGRSFGPDLAAGNNGKRLASSMQQERMNSQVWASCQT